jgi:hypothetical protein
VLPPAQLTQFPKHRGPQKSNRQGEQMIRQIDKARFNIPDEMAAAWHERAWYATDDNTILGVVLSARAGDRYSWLVLTGEDGLAIGIGLVRRTEEDATAALHDAMRFAHGDR